MSNRRVSWYFTRNYDTSSFYFPVSIHISVLWMEQKKTSPWVQVTSLTCHTLTSKGIAWAAQRGRAIRARAGVWRIHVARQGRKWIRTWVVKRFAAAIQPHDNAVRVAGVAVAARAGSVVEAVQRTICRVGVCDVPVRPQRGAVSLSVT